MFSWKRMQQNSGWPLGPLGTLATVTVGPFALWGFIYGVFWVIGTAGEAFIRAVGY